MKTILITGSTDGIGKLTALKLAKQGYQILLHGRDSKKLTNTITELKNDSNNEYISGFIADFSNFDSIKEMANQIINETSKIDVLINNAGVFNSNNQHNKNGLDLRFVVNYFAPYILTRELLPLLKNSESARVINLSSAAQSSVSIDTLIGKQSISTQEAYAQSKLALTMWSFSFAKEYPHITTIAVNPGSLLNTKMVQEAYGQHWSSADKGAMILFELATLEKHIHSSGKYFDNDKGAFNNAHQDAYNAQLIESLIAETKKIIQV